LYLSSSDFCFTALGAAANGGEMSDPQSAVDDIAVPSPVQVSEIKFRDFFVMPVGPYGLEPTEKLLSQDGKRVRIAGFIAAEEVPTPGLFILSPIPVSLSDVEDGPADDLPPTVVYVHLSGTDSQAVVRHQASPLLLTGTLSVGNRVEPNGRVSAVRLTLDAPAGSATASEMPAAARKASSYRDGDQH
jgi:hypothetical protein